MTNIKMVLAETLKELIDLNNKVTKQLPTIEERWGKDSEQYKIKLEVLDDWKIRQMQTENIMYKLGLTYNDLIPFINDLYWNEKANEEILEMKDIPLKIQKDIQSIMNGNGLSVNDIYRMFKKDNQIGIEIPKVDKTIFIDRI